MVFRLRYSPDFRLWQGSGLSDTLVAPKVGNVRLANDSAAGVDGQLAGTLCVMPDSFAVVLTGAAAKALVKERATTDSV